MSLIGGGSKSNSTAIDMRTVVDGQSRAVVGNKKTNLIETGGKAAIGKGASYQESGAVDFSNGGKLVEAGAIDASGKNNTLMMPGSAVFGTGKPGKPGKGGTAGAAGGGINYSYSVSSDNGALEKSLNWASDMFSQFINAGKEQTAAASLAQQQGIGAAVSGALNAQAAQSAGIGEQVSNAINSALSGVASAIGMGAAEPKPGEPAEVVPWYKRPAVLVGGALVGALLLYKFKRG